MRTDGLFTVRRVLFKDWSPGRTLTLIPFGDVHRDSPAHSSDYWGRFLRRIKTVPKDTWFLGIGDYTDSFSTSERVLVYAHGRHESTVKRQEQEEFRRLDVLAHELEPMRGRLIGLMGGNHFLQFTDGTTGDMRLAAKLGTSYLGSCVAIRLSFEVRSHTKLCCDIFAHHGRGAGRTAGGRYNSVEQLLSVCECDIALMGDNHACGAFKAGERLYLKDCGKQCCLKSKPRWVGRTGSFLRGYVPGESSYVVDAALPPANLGWIEFSITPNRCQEDGCDQVWLDIQCHQ